MKKLIYLCMAILCMTFASCEKDEVGGTATQALAGEWYVTVDAVDANNNVTALDPLVWVSSLSIHSILQLM